MMGDKITVLIQKIIDFWEKVAKWELSFKDPEIEIKLRLKNHFMMKEKKKAGQSQKRKKMR